MQTGSSCKHAQQCHSCNTHALQVFIDLGLPEDMHLCLFIYGGQPPGQWELKEDALPEGWLCIVCSGGKPILSDKQLPNNFRLASPDDFIPDLVRPELCHRCLAPCCYACFASLAAVYAGVHMVLCMHDFMSCCAHVVCWLLCILLFGSCYATFTSLLLCML